MTNLYLIVVQSQYCPLDVALFRSANVIVCGVGAIVFYVIDCVAIPRLLLLLGYPMAIYAWPLVLVLERYLLAAHPAICGVLKN